MPQCTFSFILWQTRAYTVTIGFLLLLKADDCNAQSALSVTATPTNPTCQYNNGSFVVNVTGGTSPYSYLSHAAQQSNTTGIFTNLAGGAFDITVTDAAGRQNTSSVTLTNTNKAPGFSALGSDPTGCNTNDGTITLTPLSGLPPYAYSINNGVTYQSGNVIHNLGPGTYGIFMKDGNGCITAPWSSQTSSYADFQSFGFGNEVNLSSSHVCLLGLEPLLADPGCGDVNYIEIFGGIGGTAPYTFSLDGGPFAAPTQDGYYSLSPGKHTVYVKDNGGLETSYTYDFPSNCPVLASPQGASCGLKDGSITVTGGNGFAPFTYAIDGLHFQAGNVFTGLAAGDYTIIVKDANGVTGSATTTVTTGCTSTTPCDKNLNLTMGPEATICEGTGTILTLQSNATAFAWSPTTGLSNAGIASPVAQPAVTTVYSVTASLGDCTQTGSVTVNVMPAPVAAASASADSICYAKSDQLRGSGGVQYQWSPATYLSDPAIADPVVQQAVTSISYQLTVTDASGCSSLVPATVSVAVSPASKVFAGDDTAVQISQGLPLQAVDVNNSGFNSYQWSPTQGLSNPFSPDPTALITGNITYFVKATTPEGCVGMDSIVIEAFAYSDIIVPNAFTPNGDGHNDLLRAIPVGMKAFRYFSVFNRWGLQVFTTGNASVGWDGTLNGRRLGSGAYVWMAGGVDYTGKTVQRRGVVLLIR